MSLGQLTGLMMGKEVSGRQHEEQSHGDNDSANSETLMTTALRIFPRGRENRVGGNLAFKECPAIAAQQRERSNFQIERSCRYNSRWDGL
jgi:hypothetical protein